MLLTFVRAISIGVVILLSGLACSQDFPTKPIRIITGSAGGGSDFDARQIAQGISGPLGQSIVVDNRANGIVAAEAVAKAPPDGYTLTVAGGAIWINTLLRKAPYDPIRDFAPMTLIERTVNVVAVHPSVPAKSIKELIALAKARPGELNYASSASGSPSHLAGELFKSMAGVNIVHVPYKGATPAITALISGEVQLMLTDSGLLLPQVKNGKLRALAVTSSGPSALAPGLLTVAASGLPGYESGGITGLLAPAKTPAPVINRLNQEIVRFLNQPDVKERFLTAGVEIVTSSPEQFAATIRSDLATTGKLIKEAGIKAE